MKNHKSKFENQILMYFSIAMIFVVLGIALSYAAGVQADVKADIVADHGANSVADNVSQQSLENTSTLSDKSGTLITVSVAGIIMLILVGAFFFIFTRRR